VVGACVGAVVVVAKRGIVFVGVEVLSTVDVLIQPEVKSIIRRRIPRKYLLDNFTIYQPSNLKTFKLG